MANFEKKFECLVKNCKKEFSDYFFYSRHLTNYHGIPINVMYLKFKSRMDFKNWKVSEEYTNNCMFSTTNNKSIYRCHRSSYIINSVKKDDLINKQDDLDRFYKVNSPCPSHMRFEIKDDVYHVMYVRTHAGYCLELKNIAISPEICEKVKEYHKQGCYERLIVDRIRRDLKDQNNTDYLITTKHIEEILNDNSMPKK